MPKIRYVWLHIWLHIFFRGSTKPVEIAPGCSQEIQLMLSRTWQGANGYFSYEISTSVVEFITTFSEAMHTVVYKGVPSDQLHALWNKIKNMTKVYIMKKPGLLEPFSIWGLPGPVIFIGAKAWTPIENTLQGWCLNCLIACNIA